MQCPRALAMKSWVIAAYSLSTFLLWGADSFASLCHQAAESSERHDYQTAILQYQRALNIRPESPEALNNLAVMYYEVGQFLDALQISSNLWPNHPELKSAALVAGMAAVQCNRPAQALKPLENLLARDPLNRDALLTLASARIALKMLPEASQVYERELIAFPNDAKAWYGLAICYENRAEQASRTLSKMAGGSVYSKRLLAEYLRSLGDPRLAAEVFGPSLEDSPDSPEAAKQYDIARALAQGSQNAFERFVSLAPDSWQAALFLGDVERQHGKLRAAVEHYQDAAKQQPDSPAPLLGLGTAYWELGEFDQAIAYLQHTLRLNPNSPQAFFELANISVRRHHETEAIPLLQKYLASQPDALEAHADLGRAYFHLKQYANAADELLKAADSDADGELHYQLFVAFKNLGRNAEARAALEKSTVIRKERLTRSQRLHDAK